MNTLVTVQTESIKHHKFRYPVERTIFTETQSVEVSKATATDVAFHFIRQHLDPKPSWSAFNQGQSTTDHEKTSVGYLPILQAPANDLDTLATVV